MAGLEDLAQLLVANSGTQSAIAAEDPYLEFKAIPDQIGQAILGGSQFKTKDRIIGGLLSGLVSGVAEGFSNDYQARAADAYKNVVLDAIGKGDMGQPDALSNKLFRAAKQQGDLFKILSGLKATDSAVELDRQTQLEDRKAENRIIEKFSTSPRLADRELAARLIQKRSGNITDTLPTMGGEGNGDKTSASRTRLAELEAQYGNYDDAREAFRKENEIRAQNKSAFDKYLTDNQALLDRSSDLTSSIGNALKGAGQTGGVPIVEELGRSALLRGEAMLQGQNSNAAKRIGARKDLNSSAVLGAAEIKAALKDSQMSEKEFEKYLGAVENTDNSLQENLAIFNKRQRLLNIAQQRQDFLRKANTEGLTLNQGQEAFRNFEKLVPISKDGDINPDRLAININDLSPTDLLDNQYEAIIKSANVGATPNVSASTNTTPSILDRVIGGTLTRPDGSVVPLDQITPEERAAISQDRSSLGRSAANAGVQFANAATLNKLPYLLAPIQTGIEEAKDLVGLGKGQSVGNNLSQAINEDRAILQAGQSEFPGTSLAAQGAGAIFSPVNKIVAPLFATGKAATLGGKLLNVFAKRAPVSAGIAAIQAAGDGDIKDAASKGALVSVGLDAVGGVVGGVAKIAPAVLNKAYGIFKSDYNAVAKTFSAKNLEKIKSSVDNGINIIKTESGVTAKEAFKSNEDFYTDMFQKAEEAIVKRTNYIDTAVENISQVVPKQKLSASIVLRNMEIRPDQKEAVISKVNELVKANNKEMPQGFSLKDINDLKRVYNPYYKYNPESVEDIATSGFIDYLRGHVENTVEKLATQNKVVSKSYSGFIQQINSEMKDLINIKNIYGKKIPGARAEEVLGAVRQSLYTTGGASTQGARNIGEALAGELGGKVGVGMAMATASNRALRPILQSFIDNKDTLRAILADPQTRSVISQMMLESPSTALNIGSSDVGNVSASQILQKKKMSDLSYQKTAEALQPAVIKQESGGKSDVVSRSGAVGLMQLMPATGKEWHKKLNIKEPYNPNNPEQNKKIGTAYLAWLLEQFNGDKELALTAYNQGIGKVKNLLAQTGGNSLSDIVDRLGPDGQKYAKRILSNFEV